MFDANSAFEIGLRFYICFIFVKIPSVSRFIDFSYAIVKLLGLLRAIRIEKSLIQSLLKRFFYFKLSLNFCWYNLWHRKCENLRVDSQKQNNPVVAIRPILDLPIFGFCVPAVATSHSCSDLVVSQRSSSLLLSNVASALDGVFKHPINSPILKR